MFPRIGSLLAAALVVAVAASAAAKDFTQGAITIEDPWARATVGGGAGAAFFALKNSGSAADQLVGAAAPVAKSAELHTHIKEGDVMRMRQIETIDVPAGGVTMLQPGGLHVMLMGMSAPLAAGTSFPLTLSFAKAGEVTVEVEVKDVAAMKPTAGGMDPHEGGNHGGMGEHHEMKHD